MASITIALAAPCPIWPRVKATVYMKVAGRSVAKPGPPPVSAITRSKLLIAAGDEKHAADELGDVVFAVANLARHLKTDPEMALRATNAKFRTRFAYVEAGLAKAGKSPAEASLDEMEALWQEAKTAK